MDKMSKNWAEIKNRVFQNLKTEFSNIEYNITIIVMMMKHH